MSEVTAKGFVELLSKSGLIEKDRLKSVLKDLARQSAGQTITIDQLTSYLLDKDVISEWHCKKLLSGKYKGFFLGKYKLIRHLGTGGMSSVYLAENTLFSQKRAIKVLPKSRLTDKTYLERFYREGRAAASLNHKNIVRVYDIDNEGDTHYLVMEYVEGRDIYDMVKEDGPLDYNTAIDYTIQSLTGLLHAHETELVHRDIKPANLLVTPDGTLKILDLGLALFQEEDTSLTVMHNERVLGTADYLSPEQAVDSHNIDHRSDIYSTGCSLYYMLTGKPPFHEGTLAQRIAMHQVREPQSVLDFRPDCPPQLVEVLKKMMAKKSDERFQNCQENIAALREVSEQLFTESTRAQPANRQATSTNAKEPARPGNGGKVTANKKKT
ncbi:MAG: serine/threonine protein kinase, partial [Pirellulaceae bacterium]